MSPAEMAAPQCGQRERGVTTDWRRGSRWMQTFAKLPTIRPKARATTVHRGVSIASGSQLTIPTYTLGSDGKRQDVTWTRPDIFDVFTLRNASGEAVRLAPGQTWIHVVPADWTIPSK